MSWTAPWALVLALPLAILFWWRWRRLGERHLRVSTLHIWRRLQQEHGTTAMKRRRPPLRFLVESMTALALVLALAGPRLSVPGELLVLVDTTGSMSTPGRRREAAATVEELKQSFEAIRVVHVQRGMGRPDQRSFWDDALVRAGWHGGPVVLVGDNLPSPEELPGSTSARVVDAEVTNAGLLGAEVVQRQSGARVFVSWGVTKKGREISRTLRMRDGEGGVIHEQLLPPVAQGIHGMTFETALPRSETLRLELQPKDDWEADNVLLLSRHRRGPGILLDLPAQAASLGEALQDACAALGLSLILTPDVGEEVVRLTQALEPPGGSPAVVFSSRRWPVQLLKAESSVKLRGALRDVPGLDSWSFRRGFMLPDQDGVQPLLEADGLALLVWDPKGQRILVADDPASRGWVEEAGFPFLLRTLLNTLGKGRESTAESWGRVRDKKSVAPDPRETLAQVNTTLPGRLRSASQETRSVAWWMVMAAACLLVLLIVDERRGILA